jgi:hypothetical protein
MAITTKRITMRQGTAAEWEQNKTKMFAGEIAIVTDAEEAYFTPKDGKPKRLATEDDIEDLQIGVDRDAIKEAVNEYLEENPPSGVVEETDPTVPSWAKQPNKPAYTASEVGALPATTTIPTKTSQLTNDSNFVTKDVTDQLSGQIADQKNALAGMTLGVYTDGLIYVFVNGEPTGTGVEFITSGGDVVGYVDSENNIVLTGKLTDGTYTLKYENEDGTETEIGTLTVDNDVPVVNYTNLADPTSSEWQTGVRINSSGATVSLAGNIISNKLAVTSKNFSLHVKGLKMLDSSTSPRVYRYNADKTYAGVANNTVSEGICSVAEYASDVYVITLEEMTCSYIAVGGALVGSADDVIITINENIE